MGGLLNVQYALKDDVLYVLEANPRASRTVPFVSKATAVPLAKAAPESCWAPPSPSCATRACCRPTGTAATCRPHAPIAVKEAVLPFHRFRNADGKGVDSLLGPEMKSTGEVMGIDTDFGSAFAKCQTAAYGSLPTTGTVFVSVANRDKRAWCSRSSGSPTSGSRRGHRGHRGDAAPQRNPLRDVRKHFEDAADGPQRGVADRRRRGRHGDQHAVRQRRPASTATRSAAAVVADIPCVTTRAGRLGGRQGIEARIRGDMTVRSLQELHAALRGER